MRHPVGMLPQPHRKLHQRLGAIAVAVVAALTLAITLLTIAAPAAASSARTVATVTTATAANGLTAEATGSGTAAANGSGQHWKWPTDPPHRIRRPFIAPATPYSAGHRGIDIGAAVGANIYAPADGVIHFAGVVAGRPVISIEHGGGIISSFEPVTSTLAAGTPVRRGDTIGALQSGHCGAPCLHFGVRLHGQYISPINYLGGIPLSILLPTRAIR